jgi:hypothetical protein
MTKKAALRMTRKYVMLRRRRSIWVGNGEFPVLRRFFAALRMTRKGRNSMEYDGRRVWKALRERFFAALRMTRKAALGMTRRYALRMTRNFFIMVISHIYVVW